MCVFSCTDNMLIAGIILDGILWLIVYRFYETLRCMEKLTRSATIAIPYPPPKVRIIAHDPK